MELRDALCQISQIRRQIALSEVFRGYRSLTVGASGVLALVAAASQSHCVPSPENNLARYLGLWISVAAVSASLAAGELFWRTRRANSVLARTRTLLAIEQFLPSLIVGALLTACIFRLAPQVGWMLPGLWALFFSLGIFASVRLLPAQVVWVGLYYVAAGVACLAWGHPPHAFSPWLMGLSFGGGQLLAAAVLYWTLERNHDS